MRVDLRRQIEQIPGLHLADIRFDTERATNLVRAVVRGPAPPSTEQIAVMQASLPSPPKGDPLELRVRFVKIEILTARGSLIYHNRLEEIE